MLDDLEKLYVLMRKHLPELANYTDTLIGTEKEKFIQSVEPVVKQFIEQRTKNVSDIKNSFAEKVNEPVAKPAHKPSSGSYYNPYDSFAKKPKDYTWVIVGVIAFVGGVIATRWVLGVGKGLKSHA